MLEVRTDVLTTTPESCSDANQMLLIVPAVYGRLPLAMSDVLVTFVPPLLRDSQGVRVIIVNSCAPWWSVGQITYVLWQGLTEIYGQSLHF